MSKHKSLVKKIVLFQYTQVVSYVQLPKCLLVHLTTCYTALNPRQTFGDENCGLTVQSPSAVVESLSTSAPYPETLGSPGLAPLVGVSGFPSCLFMEKLDVIQWKVMRRVRGLEDVSCKERLDLFNLIKRRLGGT